MGVRWALINGLDRKQIKVVGTSLFVDGNLLGKVKRRNTFDYEDGTIVSPGDGAATEQLSNYTHPPSPTSIHLGMFLKAAFCYYSLGFEAFYSCFLLQQAQQKVGAEILSFSLY